MISFPNAKINLGLHVLRKRDDGFHDIETLFFPVPLHDSLEIIPASDGQFAMHQHGIPLPEGENLCARTYLLLKNDFDIPAVKIHLLKNIPAGAGLGGGSSDAAFTLIMLNEMFGLSIAKSKLMEYASEIGSDCAFFIENSPALAGGRGEVLEPLELELSGKHITIVKPGVHVSTAEAYRMLTPDAGRASIRELVALPLQKWKDALHNDFEEALFKKHPVIASVKAAMYDAGAVYASMSGSGSAVYGIFDDAPAAAPAANPLTKKMFSFTSVLS